MRKSLIELADRMGDAIERDMDRRIARMDEIVASSSSRREAIDRLVASGCWLGTKQQLEEMWPEG